jgi:hypothetical protein
MKFEVAFREKFLCLRENVYGYQESQHGGESNGLVLEEDDQAMVIYFRRNKPVPSSSSQGGTKARFKLAANAEYRVAALWLNGCSGYRF